MNTVQTSYRFTEAGAKHLSLMFARYVPEADVVIHKTGPDGVTWVSVKREQDIVPLKNLLYREFPEASFVVSAESCDV